MLTAIMNNIGGTLTMFIYKNMEIISNNAMRVSPTANSNLKAGFFRFFAATARFCY